MTLSSLLVAGLGVPLWLPVATITAALIGAWLALADQRGQDAEDVRFEVIRIRADPTWGQSRSSRAKPHALLDETATRPGASPLLLEDDRLEGIPPAKRVVEVERALRTTSGRNRNGV